MRVIVVEDDPVSRQLLEQSLQKWGYAVTACSDGRQALRVLRREPRPALVLLDWMMPEMDGLEVCRHLEAENRREGLYLIFLTARSASEDVVSGLDAGADDYVVKPFDPGELRARVRVGERMLDLQRELASRVSELEGCIAQIRQLRGLIPICSYCKRIRNDGNYWQQIEVYVASHSEARFTHGVCPDCFEAHVRPKLEALERESGKESAPSSPRRGSGAAK